MGIYQSMSNWKNRNHSRYFKHRGFSIGNWLQGYWRPGDEKGDTEIVKINHIYGWWNKREEMVSPDLGVQRKEPRGWCAGMICGPLVEGLNWGWWLALGVLKEAWGWSCGSFLLLHRDADRSQKTKDSFSVPPAFLSLTRVSHGRNCQEASWQRSLGNEFRV